MEGQQRSGHAYEDVTHPTGLHSGDERHGQNPVHGQGKVEDEGAQETKIGLPTVLDDDPNAPKDRPEDKTSSNYQSKVTDTTGANKEEAGTTPLVQSFEKMSVNEGIRAEKGAGEVGGTEEEGKSKATTDKGVSMKKYLAEKFKPGEEDKALSEVIAGTLSKHKDKTEGREEEKPTGKVKESEEVTKLTGPTDEQGVAAAATHSEGSGKSIVGRIKGAASSWFGKGTGKSAAQSPTVSDTN
ncbi:PREDICTED: low-temperature-induced 78 kDa protein-like [Nicotiana attenuata]|uniref:Low-temperature-induced 65 kDa protein n=1 Tax=Nicotiana attenuata TaxID=49451 RepID=A0A314KJH3_NICAT|nr:PREDICTED: low-temperature-induced 78 kDa protein-like [Nicotiana attenuata]OIT29561.1 low-temperature-induced 65 kda protein [Nicotiana attenuata]